MSDYFSGDDTPQAWLLGLKTSIPLTGYGFGVFSLTFIFIAHFKRTQSSVDTTAHLALEQGVILDREPLSVKVSDERFTCLFSANKFYPRIPTV